MTTAVIKTNQGQGKSTNSQKTWIILLGILLLAGLTIVSMSYYTGVNPDEIPQDDYTQIYRDKLRWRLPLTIDEADYESDMEESAIEALTGLLLDLDKFELSDPQLRDYIDEAILAHDDERWYDVLSALGNFHERKTYLGDEELYLDDE